MNRSKYFIANWKMYFSYHQAVTWIDTYYEQLSTTLNAMEQILIICPSFELIPIITHRITTGPIYLGAQDCSPYPQGAYTGQVSALSLKQFGCDYSIIGHSETRYLLGVTNQSVAQKAQQLLSNDIIPIICVGETAIDYQNGTTYSAIAQQLTDILPIYIRENCTDILIAYEPVWAIGTGITPSVQQLEIACRYITEYIKKSIPDIIIRIVYGGSVSSQNIDHLIPINEIDGFLIGGKSIDFQELKKIVSLR